MKYQILQELERRIEELVKDEFGTEVEVHLQGTDVSDRDRALLTVQAALLRGKFTRKHPINPDHVKTCDVCRMTDERDFPKTDVTAAQFVMDHLDLLAELRLEEGRR